MATKHQVAYIVPPSVSTPGAAPDPAVSRLSPRAMGWALASALVAAGAWYSVAPLRAAIRGWNDFAFVYAAGRAWSHGRSAYDVLSWRAEWSSIRPSFLSAAPSQPFLYPPYWALLAVPLSFLPWPVAERLWDVMNVAAYAGACLLAVRLLQREKADALSHPLTWALVGLASLNGAVRWCLWESQLAMISLAGVVGAFWALSERKTAWLAVFSFIAALKPQIAFLPLFYLLLAGGARGVLAGGAGAVVVSLAAFHGLAPSELVRELRSDYRLHMAIAFNAPDRFFSVSALFGFLDPDARLTRLSPLLGMAVVPFATGLWRGSRPQIAAQASPLWALALVLTWVAALVPLHGYDLIIYTPLLILLPVVRPRWLSAGLGGLAIFASRIPRLTDALHLGPIVPYATFAVAVGTTVGWRLTRPDLEPDGSAELAA